MGFKTFDRGKMALFAMVLFTCCKHSFCNSLNTTVHEHDSLAVSFTLIRHLTFNTLWAFTADDTLMLFFLFVIQNWY